MNVDQVRFSERSREIAPGQQYQIPPSDYAADLHAFESLGLNVEQVRFSERPSEVVEDEGGEESLVAREARKTLPLVRLRWSDMVLNRISTVLNRI